MKYVKKMWSILTFILRKESACEEETKNVLALIREIVDPKNIKTEMRICVNEHNESKLLFFIRKTLRFLVDRRNIIFKTETYKKKILWVFLNICSQSQLIVSPMKEKSLWKMFQI